MTRRLPSALLALALAVPPLGGCAGDRSAAPDPLVVISGPKAFQSFALRDAADRVIWRLAADPPAPVPELLYGDVPAGFRQETPAGGDVPRALVLGEMLRLESVTPLRVFKHEGWVTSGQRLSIDHWEMKLRHPPTPAELDAAPKTP